MTWNPMQSAPKERAIRVVILDGGRCELPWYVFWRDGCWRYQTTGVPLHSWHTPVGWSDEPRGAKQQAWCDEQIGQGYGSFVLPSGARAA